jgi:CheY-like chemotaxis protein
MPVKYLPVINKGKPNTPASLTFMINKPVQAPPKHNKTKTILLVEDSEPAIIQLKDLLEEQEINILVARDGGEALAYIAHTTPDAMILDLMMPGIDGFQVLELVRASEKTAHLPVLILTSKLVTKTELGKLKENNIHQLIRKGDVNPEELMNAVNTMLAGKSQPAEGPREVKQAGDSTPVVLIVEDNPDNMLAAKSLLEGKFVVIEARDGFEGVKRAKEFKPDFIFMDIELPGMNGIEAFKNIRQDPELLHIPVIALTASAMAHDQETILAHGFDAYVAKPIDETVFFTVINKTLYGE